ncbi:hypothetical protein BSG1_00555 [Bacillus sp. SG-1]|nr:hypothetical protein BSG1_00555 [Bacillus sp. SG-1]
MKSLQADKQWTSCKDNMMFNLPYIFYYENFINEYQLIQVEGAGRPVTAPSPWGHLHGPGKAAIYIKSNNVCEKSFFFIIVCYTHSLV